MVKAFEAKYPGVKVEAYRVSGSEMTTRMMEEAKAKRYIADAVETTEGICCSCATPFCCGPIIRRISVLS